MQWARLKTHLLFSGSPKRQNSLRQAIDSKCLSASHKRLKSLCGTRFVERHDSVIVFTELYPAVLQALDITQEESNREASSKADAMSHALSNCRF
jgi:hypothetical protein